MQSGAGADNNNGRHRKRRQSMFLCGNSVDGRTRAVIDQSINYFITKGVIQLHPRISSVFIDRSRQVDPQAAFCIQGKREKVERAKMSEF